MDKATILIVDDDPTTLAVFFEYLEESGFEISVAQSGEGAIRQLEHFHPDLILLDVVMPGIDGFETCRKLMFAFRQGGRRGVVTTAKPNETRK